MGLRIGSFINSIQSTFNRIDTRVKSIAQNITVQSLSKVQDLVSLAANLTSARAGSSLMNARGSFPLNPAGMSVDLVRNATRTLATAMSSSMPEASYDGTMTSYPKGRDLGSEPKVYLINGINTNQAGRERIANATANRLGVNVNMIHNSTQNPVMDVIECIKQLVLGIPSKPSKTLSDEIYKNLTANPPQKMELIGESQGSIMVTHGISLAIDRMKKEGYSDEQIKSLMSENVNVKLVGTPVDLDNPLHTILNVPPGLAGIGGKRLDWYFTTEDRVLYGKGVPFDERIRGEQGKPGELSKPNFQMIRHEKDLVATVVHDLGTDDLDMLIKSPGLFLLTQGARLAYTLGGSFLEQGNAVAYHSYENVYLQYMVNEGMFN